MNHFLDIADIDAKELRHIIDRAKAIKTDLKAGKGLDTFKGKHIALVFEKPSTRTRVSFEVGMNQLGGDAIVLTSDSSQLGRGETIADTARVLSGYVDMIMLRTFAHEALKEMAEFANVPVINGLTDSSHPCQIMTDIMTFEEHRGSIKGKTVAWLGDINNMTFSWIEAAEKFDFTLNIAHPDGVSLPTSRLNDHVNAGHDAVEAVKGADLVTTDTWVSMGDEGADHKIELLAPFQVNEALMKEAADDAVFMHCLPAHRGDEVTNSVIDSEQSVVWDEVENRLHCQKAIMLWCLGNL